LSIVFLCSCTILTNENAYETINDDIEINANIEQKENIPSIVLTPEPTISPVPTAIPKPTPIMSADSTVTNVINAII